LPNRLPKKTNVIWEIDLAREGLGGIAANESFVVFGDRDFDDLHDVFYCLDAKTGRSIWQVERLSIAQFDYGNSPRATPLIVDGFCYCFGATGILLCIEMRTGRVVWERDFRLDFPITEELPWGHCGSPLIADGKLIVSPGNPDAAIVALNPNSGATIWQTTGRLPGYGSHCFAKIGGRGQIIGHDNTTLGGWDVETGERLWTIEPNAPGDFNVPTPVVHGDNLIVCTRNNGTRRFSFSGGFDQPKLVTQNKRLRPDMTTPVVAGHYLYCVRDFVYCLDISSGLDELWRMRAPALSDYASLFVSADRVMIVADGEILLFATDGTKRVIDRLKIFEKRAPIYSHPAIVGRRLYVRGVSKLRCIDLGSASEN